MDRGTDIIFARSVIMMLMVFIQNINVLNCRSEKRTVFKEPLHTNPILLLTVVGSIGLQLIMAEIPITALFLKVTPLETITIVKLLLLSFVIIVVYEIYKIILKEKKGDN